MSKDVGKAPAYQVVLLATLRDILECAADRRDIDGVVELTRYAVNLVERPQ